MSDAELILVAGALLAAGIGASLLAGSPATAGTGPLPRPRDGDRHRRHRLDRLQRLRAGANDWRHRPCPDPVRGGPDVRLPRDPSRAAAGAVAGGAGDDRDRAWSPGSPPAGCSTSPSWRGCCWARSSPPPTARRSSPCLRGSTLRRRLAYTLEAESGFNDPVAILLVLGFIDWIQQPGYGIADMAWLFARELGIGAGRGRGGGGWRRLDLPAPELGDGRPLSRGLDRHRRASPTAARRSSTAPAFWPCIWRGWRWAAPIFRPNGRSPPSTRASPGWPRSRSSCRLGCSPSRVISETCSSKEPWSPWWSRSWLGRSPPRWQPPSIASALASGSSSGGRGSAARSRWCLRPSR